MAELEVRDEVAEWTRLNSWAKRNYNILVEVRRISAYRFLGYNFELSINLHFINY